MPEISTSDIERLMRKRELEAELSEIENDIDGALLSSDGALLSPMDGPPLGLKNDMPYAPAEISTLRGQPGAVSEEETFQDPRPLGLDNDMTPPPNDGGSTDANGNVIDMPRFFGGALTPQVKNGKFVGFSSYPAMGNAGRDNYSTDANGDVIEMPRFFGGALTPQVKNGKFVGFSSYPAMADSSQLSQGQEPTPSQAVSAQPPRNFDDEMISPSGSQPAAKNHGLMMQELLKGRRGQGIF